MTNSRNRHLWKITINDGYVAYEYELFASNGNVGINDILRLAKNKLRATEGQRRKVWSPIYAPKQN